MNRFDVAPCQCSSPGSKEDAVAGANQFDLGTTALRESNAFRHPNRLAVRMRVPRGASGRREMDATRAQARSGRRRGNRIDVDNAGEPLLRSRRGLNAVPRDLHDRSPVSHRLLPHASGPQSRDTVGGIGYGRTEIAARTAWMQASRCQFKQLASGASRARTGDLLGAITVKAVAPFRHASPPAPAKPF
jgi:hypothetical protein